MFSPSTLVLAALCLLPAVVVGNDCRAATFSPANAKRGLPWLRQATSKTSSAAPLNTGAVAAGQLNCRYWLDSGPQVNYYTCSSLAQFYEIPNDRFFQLNPSLKRDCSNVAPNTNYCVEGYIQSLVSTDGFCGPNHNNATCQDTDFPCCNSQTWKCGNTTVDCAPGTCWSGACFDHTVYSTDGKCGAQSGYVQCVGGWGSCCNFQGVCGNGAGFCDDNNCSYGNCTTPPGPGKPRSYSVSASSVSSGGTVKLPAQPTGTTSSSITTTMSSTVSSLPVAPATASSTTTKRA